MSKRLNIEKLFYKQLKLNASLLIKKNILYKYYYLRSGMKVNNLEGLQEATCYLT